MPNELKSAEVVFYDYLRRSQAERHRADFAGSTSGSITFADTTTLSYTSIAQLDIFIDKAKSTYAGIIGEYSGSWALLANQAKAMLEDLLVDGEFNNDGYTDSLGTNYNRKPLAVIQGFIDWCEQKAIVDQIKVSGGIVGVINVP